MNVTQKPHREEDLLREGAAAWRALSESARAKLLEGGIGIPSEEPSGGVPFLIPFETLFLGATLALRERLAHVFTQHLAPRLARVLAGLARAVDHAPPPNADLVRPSRWCRLLLHTALSVLGKEPPDDLAPLVKDELAHMRMALPKARSVGFSRILDYRDFGATDPALTVVRLLSERRMRTTFSPTGDRSLVRDEIRSALLLREAYTSLSADEKTSYREMLSIWQFLFGPSEDHDLETFASITQKGLTDDWKQSAVRVDEIEARARGRSVAIVSERLLPDGEVLLRMRHHEYVPEPGSTPHPSAFDVALFLGAPDVAPFLATQPGRKGGLSFLEQFAAHAEPAWHSSLYHSGLDVLRTYLRPSDGDTAFPFADHLAWRKRKTASTLAMWTWLRSPSLSLARAPLPKLPDTVVFEPHPEAIGKLIAWLEQASRGLSSLLGEKADFSEPIAMLLGAEEEVEQFLDGEARRVAVPLLHWAFSLEAQKRAPVAFHAYRDPRFAVREEVTAPRPIYLIARSPASPKPTLVLSSLARHQESVITERTGSLPSLAGQDPHGDTWLLGLMLPP